jgi:hypothetical protein
MSCVHMAILLPSLSLTNIENLLPTQAVRLGKRIVACGDVAGLTLVSRNDENCVVKGFVHSEMTAVKWYEVNVRFDLIHETVLSSECVCKGNIRQHYCKHIAALLLACVALNDFANEVIPPKIFRRSNMKRFESAPQKLQEQVEFDLTWIDIINRLQNPPSKKRKYSTSYNVFISKPEKPKKKIRIINDLTT